MEGGLLRTPFSKRLGYELNTSLRRVGIFVRCNELLNLIECPGSDDRGGQSWVGPGKLQGKLKLAGKSFRLPMVGRLSPSAVIFERKLRPLPGRQLAAQVLASQARNIQRPYQRASRLFSIRHNMAAAEKSDGVHTLRMRDRDPGNGIGHPPNA